MLTYATRILRPEALDNCGLCMTRDLFSSVSLYNFFYIKIVQNATINKIFTCVVHQCLFIKNLQIQRLAFFSLAALCALTWITRFRVQCSH